MYIILADYTVILFRAIKIVLIGFFYFAVPLSMNNMCRDKRITDEVTKITGAQRSNNYVYISPIFVFVECIVRQNAFISHFVHEFQKF